MDSKEIRIKYLKCIEERIQQAESFANNPKFDQLIAVCHSMYGYHFFHPLNHTGNEFDSICRLFITLLHDIDDDGYLCFVHVQYKCNVAEVRLVMDDCFVVSVEPTFLTKDMLLEIVKKHSPCVESITDFKFCRFNWETLEFLFSLIEEFKRIEKIGAQTSTFENTIKYSQERKKIEDKFVQYIRENI